MEEHLWNQCEHTLSLVSNATDKPLILQTLASVRSLITNSSTSEPSISAIFETLTRLLELSHDSHVLRHVLKLLSDLVIHRSHLSHPVFNSVRAHSLLSTESTRLAAESLSVLSSIAEQDRTLVSAMDELDDNFFVSLCFRPSVSVRSWLLSNAERFHVRPYLLLTVLLGFTKDPYPYVRRVSLDGLVKLSKSIVCDDRGVIEGCYCRAIELLNDMEDCVRSAAVRAVTAWGRMLVASNLDGDKKDWSDALFVQLCSMVRDMSVEVRVEAFEALGMTGMVSDYILLQTLSKKVLRVTKEKKSLARCTAKQFDISALSAAGAFVHGLEDEFYEVRRSACFALRTLTILSAEFAGEALNLLMDMLNDDSLVVRLQALETMHHMATYDCLKIQETHMHMFLGTLADNDTLVRSAARKILRLMKLPNLEMFKSSIDGLIKTLELFPQDEVEVFSVLFNIGRNHGNFAACIIKEVSQEIELPREGKLSFNSVRITALLVLAISAPLLHDQSACSIPPRIYSYAVTFLGRISRALSDVMSQNTLLAYLSQCCRSTSSVATEFKEEESFLPVIKGDIPNCTGIEIISSSGVPLQQISDGPYEIPSQKTWEPREVATPVVEYQPEVDEEVTKYMKLILAKVEDIWPLIQSGCIVEVLKTFRSFKEELSTFTTDSLGCAGAVAFMLQYLQVVKLLAKVWIHVLPARKLHFHGMGELDLLLGKIDRSLIEMRYRFMGLSKEEELHVLELILVTSILRLSKVEVCCHCTTLKKLSCIISRVEFLHKEGSIEPSKFVIELKKLLCEIGTSMDGASRCPFLFKKLLEFFTLKQFVYCGRLKHIRAEVEIPDNDSENPLPFVSGLPVGIPFKITLYNILREHRLWLTMTVGESTQFVFLDLNQFEGCDKLRNFTYIVPFYNTPKAVSFTLRVSLGMECLFEEVNMVKACRGPKRKLTYLCQDVEVYLSMGVRG